MWQSGIVARREPLSRLCYTSGCIDVGDQLYLRERSGFIRLKPLSDEQL